MEKTDREILQNVLAQRVGKVVSEIVKNTDGIADDIAVGAFVETPTCYYDDNGERHTGKLITVNVEFIDDMEEEDS